MLRFISRRKRNPIPQIYRTLAKQETGQVAGGIYIPENDLPPGGIGSMKDPNG